MTSLALPFGFARRDETRWTICFVVMLLAHGAIALTLLNETEEPDFGVDTAVVTMELPESLLTLATPPTDLAPGPKEEESEATPAPKEETKPPEPEADVAMPEPPKPEPPQEQKQATAPQSSAAPIAVVRRWESELIAHIERFKHYPADARARGDTGLVRVIFTIDREGRVLASHLAQSSGSLELDQEALAMLTRAQPMPRPPERVLVNELSFAIPVRFNMR
jgi:periplasmic protein TonB